MAKRRRKSRKVREDLSLHPLSPEEALDGFLQVDPEKVKEAERREREKEARDADDEGDDG